MTSFSQRASKCSSKIGSRLLNLCDTKQTNLALSADVTQSSDLLLLADELGPEICVLKTHIDIISDFTPQLTRELSRLASHHQFLIFEDRKFADIGNTVKHQFAGGIYHIAHWADIVNAHSLPGPGIIQGILAATSTIDNSCGLLLIAEMSSEGNLLSAEYSLRTLELARQYPEIVMGFITQHRLSNEERDLGLINFTPGVQLTAASDELGQQYVTPESAIIDHGADIIIVGRGITGAKDPLAAAKKYRKTAWDCYQKR